MSSRSARILAQVQKSKWFSMRAREALVNFLSKAIRVWLTSRTASYDATLLRVEHGSARSQPCVEALAKLVALCD